MLSLWDVAYCASFFGTGFVIGAACGLGVAAAIYTLISIPRWIARRNYRKG